MVEKWGKVQSDKRLFIHGNPPLSLSFSEHFPFNLTAGVEILWIHPSFIHQPKTQIKEKSIDLSAETKLYFFLFFC